MRYTVHHDWATGLWEVRDGFLYRALDDASWKYILGTMELLDALDIRSLEGHRAVMESL